MTKKQVIIKELSSDLFVVQNNSPLIKIIEFGQILHLLMLEAELVKDNEWSDFAFCINLKLIDSNNEIVIFNSLEIKNLVDWLDWICRIIVTSEGFHNETKFIKQFISSCDSMFIQLKESLGTEQIIIEKMNQTKNRI
jgi:hypothetical protein